MKNENAQVKERSVTGFFLVGVRILGRVTLTLAIALGALFAVQFGSAELTRRADAAPLPDAAALTPVSVSPVVLQESYTVSRAFVGQVEPQKTVALSFELAGRLDVVTIDEGDRVEAGQILASQDLSLLHSERERLEATRTATEAQLTFANQTVDRNAELVKTGVASQARFDEAVARQAELTARIAEIDASLNNVGIRVQKSQIIAPFDGQVTERLVDGGEILAPGQQVFGLVELAKPQVRIGVPLGLTESGLEDANIEVGSDTHVASLVSLRPDIDPVTRTRTAIFEVETDAALLFGQTARLILEEQIDVSGVWLPTTSLKEGVRGQWTVLTVDGDMKVRASSVEVLHAESERVFVRGAFPDGTVLIDEGPQRVTVGQQVSFENEI